MDCNGAICMQQNEPGLQDAWVYGKPIKYVFPN